MIQFNLLPDIKIQYLKAKRQQHVVVVVSVLASLIALAIFIVLLTTVFVLQKKNLNDLNKDIKTASNQLYSIKNLDKILTVQNQLGVLTDLHTKKVVSSRLLDYLKQLTPADASISKVTVDYAEETMVISGSAGNLTTVNTYTDTLKFTKYTTAQDNEEKNAFSEVVLQSFTRDSKSTTYAIAFKFDPLIFSNQEEIKLKVPQIITTRSEVEKPTALFQEGQ